ncbi:hypothetical protein LINPERPRIM_LOCUS24078 [Linum perenne]
MNWNLYIPVTKMGRSSDRDIRSSTRIRSWRILHFV